MAAGIEDGRPVGIDLLAEGEDRDAEEGGRTEDEGLHAHLGRPRGPPADRPDRTEHQAEEDGGEEEGGDRCEDRVADGDLREIEGLGRSK